MLLTDSIAFEGHEWMDIFFLTMFMTLQIILRVEWVSWDVSCFIVFKHDIIVFGLEFGIGLRFLPIFLFGLILFGVVGWRNLQNRINNNVIILVLSSCVGEEVLVDGVEGPWVDFGGDV